MNIPNVLTVSRFALSMVFFVLLSSGSPILLDVGLVVLVLAAATDISDGIVARKMGETSFFGEVGDPVVDKILICGSFVFFAAGFGGVTGGRWAVSPWAPTLIIGRELIVSGLRSYADARGAPIGSTIFGKSKMVVQFTAVCIVVLIMSHFRGSMVALGAATGAVWVAVFVTLATGGVYLVRVESILRRARSA